MSGWPGFVVEFLLLVEVGADGRTRRSIFFDPDALDEARAELDRLASVSPENAAVRTITLIEACRVAGDWDGLRSLFDPDFVHEDRRTGVRQRSLSVDDLVKAAAGDAATSLEFEVVELRGDRLALTLWAVRTAGPGFVVEFVLLVEVGEDGRVRRNLLFDPDAIDDARAELDRLASVPPENAAVRNTVLTDSCMAAGDWVGFRSRFDPDCVHEDRRTGVRDRRLGIDDVITSAAAAHDVGLSMLDREVIDVRGDRLALFRERIPGSFEVEFLLLVEVGPDGRTRRSIMLDPDALDEGRAELDRLASAAPENTAVRRIRQADAFVLAGDWEGYRDQFSPEVTYEDRRAGFADQRLGLDDLVATVRVAADVGIDHIEDDVVALRGDDLALVEVRGRARGVRDRLPAAGAAWTRRPRRARRPVRRRRRRGRRGGARPAGGSGIGQPGRSVGRRVDRKPRLGGPVHDPASGLRSR